MKKNAVRLIVLPGALLLLGLGIAFAMQQLHPAAKVIPTTRVQKGTL